VTEVKGVKAMKRYILLAGVAGALALVPTAAFAGTDGNYEDPITFENHVSTTVWNASYQLDATALLGYVTLNGSIDPDSAASAITDAKQILDYEDVTFSDPGDHHDGGKDLVPNNEHDHGGASVDNDAESGEVTGSGNVGVNVAAGQYNMQQNSGNIAVSGDPSSEADGGWASAATTGYQSLTDTTYGSTDNMGPALLPPPPGGGTNYSDENEATAGDVSADGNVGVNVAAGAFNQQQNLMTLAVANNSVLSQSTAALWQTASCNTIDIQNQENEASSGAVSGAGNIGVNVAAGVGNQQQNSLTAAVSNSTGM
jgi:hypothetical protein